MVINKTSTKELEFSSNLPQMAVSKSTRKT
jgi:hypothetical protein